MRGVIVVKKKLLSKKFLTVIAVFTVVLTVFTSTAFADYYTEGKVLYAGMQSSNVTDLQRDLKTLGYFGSYQPTGYFGAVTQQMVKKYQAQNYLVADGVVGYATARAIKVDRVLQTAKWYIGVPYVWGGTSPSGFDCSGFVHHVMLQNNIIIPRTTELQYEKGTWVDRSQLRPGDLVFFTTYRPGPSHVGIYLGNNQFIQASSGADQIIISDLSNSYYASHYIGAKRVIW